MASEKGCLEEVRPCSIKSSDRKQEAGEPATIGIEDRNKSTKEIEACKKDYCIRETKGDCCSFPGEACVLKAKESDDGTKHSDDGTCSLGETCTNEKCIRDQLEKRLNSILEEHRKCDEGEECANEKCIKHRLPEGICLMRKRGTLLENVCGQGDESTAVDNATCSNEAGAPMASKDTCPVMSPENTAGSDIDEVTKMVETEIKLE